MEPRPGKRKSESNLDTYKVLLLGDAGVGKSSLLRRYTEGIYSISIDATVGIDYRAKILNCEGKTIKLQIWDTAGQERFKTLTQAFYRSCDGICIVYDIMNRNSLISVEQWVRQAKQCAPEDIKMVLLGNKTDDEKRREISYDEGYQFASSLGLTFFEVSVKENSYIDEGFYELATQIKKVKDGKMKKDDEGVVLKPELVNPENLNNPSSQSKCC